MRIESVNLHLVWRPIRRQLEPETKQR